MFGVGSGLQRGVAFLLLPVYTRALTPAEYGTLSVLLAVTSAAAIVFAFGLDMGLFRSFFLHAEDRRRVFVGSVWRLLVVAPVLAAFVCAAIAAPFVHGIPRVTPLDVFLALLAGALYVGASAVPLVVLRVQRRLRDFLLLSLVDAIATPVLTLIFVVGLHEGILGWLIASAASNVILLVAAFRIVPWERGVPFERDTVRRRRPLRRDPDPARVRAVGAVPDRPRSAGRTGRRRTSSGSTAWRPTWRCRSRSRSRRSIRR